jgi:DNA repair and recombination protein RadB
MKRISTGSFDFNSFLGGGYEPGVVSMFVGPPGSGKSNFVILFACSIARHEKVIFVDTEGGFSVDRVCQIVGKEKLKDILENIFVLNPVDFSAQEASFEKLKKYLKEGNVGSVIVDSIGILYRLELGEASVLKNEERVNEVNLKMLRQIKDLVEIARVRQIPVVVTNQVYSNFFKTGEGDFGIVGGDIFQYWSKCIIEVTKSGGRKVKVLKHRSLGEKEMKFEIRDDGIFRKKGIFLDKL